ncbi:MAG: hypothetical protein COB37_10770 [Kordiimonadales bacterium]|nr:MAG: hypothetical protein COB37_10770 [Kordiimonadales bacterium]
MSKVGFLGNPIDRHYLINFGLFLPGTILGTAIAYTAGYNPAAGMFVVAIPVWALMFYSGRCQHCKKQIPQVRWFVLPDKLKPTDCSKRGKSYSERAGD